MYLKQNHLKPITKYNKILDLIINAKRPILILGWGVHLSNSYKEIKLLINKLKFPVVTTWAISHIIDEKNKFKIGTWGTHGMKIF